MQHTLSRQSTIHAFPTGSGGKDEANQTERMQESHHVLAVLRKFFEGVMDYVFHDSEYPELGNLILLCGKKTTTSETIYSEQERREFPELVKLPHLSQIVLCPGSRGDTLSQASADLTTAITRASDCMKHLMDVFTSKWDLKHGEMEDLFGEKKWYEVRGVYGETMLHLLGILINLHNLRGTKGASFYRVLICKMLEERPELASVPCKVEPWVGMTLLHMSCAEAELIIIDAILALDRSYVDVNAEMVGEYIQETKDAPPGVIALGEWLAPSTDEESHRPIQTPLEVALLAPHEDNLSLATMKKLLDAPHPHSASTIFLGKKTKTRLYTILHVLAKAHWFGAGPHQISANRVQMVVRFFMDQRNVPYCNKCHPSMPNHAGVTPIQAAAAIGNLPMFVEMLRFQKKYLPSWGDSVQMLFPLAELDSADRDDAMCALEYMTLHKRGDLLRIGIIRKIIMEKWNKFGYAILVIMLLWQTVAVICTAIVCLDGTFGYSATRRSCQVIVITLTLVYCILAVVLYIACARNEPWFKQMDSFPFLTEKVSKWQILQVRYALEMGLMSIMVITVPLESEHYSFVYLEWWYFGACLWWVLFVVYLLDFFCLFKSTTPIASALPELVTQDVGPWMALYTVIFMGFGMSLRLAAKMAPRNVKDNVLGSLWGTIVTLEESVFGPDVQFRRIHENHPLLVFAIFVAFLWATTFFMNMLVAMFTKRYETLKDHTDQVFLFNRAKFIITAEKIMPHWLYVGLDLQIGEKHVGELVYQDWRAEAEDAQTPDVKSTKTLRRATNVAKIRHLAGPSQDYDLTDDPESGERDSLMPRRDRWIMWKTDKNTGVDNWKESKVEDDVFRL